MWRSTCTLSLLLLVHAASSHTCASMRTQVYTTQTLMTHFIHLLISGTCLERKERVGKRGRKEAHQLLVCKQNRRGTLTPPTPSPPIIKTQQGSRSLTHYEGSSAFGKLVYRFLSFFVSSFLYNLLPFASSCAPLPLLTFLLLSLHQLMWGIPRT